MEKVIDKKAAIDLIKSGDSIMVGGFGMAGCPMNLVYELVSRNDLEHLTLISEGFLDGRLPWDEGFSGMLPKHMLDKIIVSFFGNPKAQKYVDSGEIELELSPMGTLAERIRAGGAGLGGFFTPTGAGTIVEEGKETRIIDGRKYVFEKPLHANVALIKAEKADRYGNGQFAYTANNFNTAMATAADIVILECHELVECGELHPNFVQLPGVFVDYVVECKEVRF